MASTGIRERRRTFRYRNLLFCQGVQLKNKIAVLLMEAGVRYNRRKFHKVGYFRDLLKTKRGSDESPAYSCNCAAKQCAPAAHRKQFNTVAGARGSSLLNEWNQLMTIPAVKSITG
jgi:hypothetical protein